MNPPPTRAGGAARSGEAESLALVIQIDEERLRYPHLMDPEAVEELVAQGFEIYPAFRLRKRHKIDFDITLLTGEPFAFAGDFVAHTWFLAAPPNLPRLRFRRDPDAPHRCFVSWSEEGSTEAEERHNRYLELRHRGKGPQIPLAVMHKPDPQPFDASLETAARESVPVPLPSAASADVAVFGVSFLEVGGSVRPWFEIFRKELFPPGVEPELVLEARTRGFALELLLSNGDFLLGGKGEPQIRFFDAFGSKVGQPAHIQTVQVTSANRFRMEWTNPPEETVTSFEILCRHEGKPIWLDPTIYTKGIGP